MNKSTLIIVGILLIFGMYGCSSYNGMAKKQLAVDESWSKVQSQYQRRFDLFKNLVSTVQGVADFEKSTLTEVIQARASATQIKLDPTNMTPEKMQEFQAAQGNMMGAFGRLMAVAENYPQLKATQNFSDLQSQIEGTENRITVARNDFNTSVKEYNQSIITFPANIMAGIFNFSKRPFFEANTASQSAPDINFKTSK